MKILFVCSGNICRSPTAEGLVKKLCNDAGLDCEFDSAGTHGLHAGEAPDPRATKTALREGGIGHYDQIEIAADIIGNPDFQICLIAFVDIEHSVATKVTDLNVVSIQSRVGRNENTVRP